MGLTPGAIISGTTAASPATLVVRNLGAGDALRVEGTTSLNGNLSVSGSLVGGTHSHDASYYNKTQTDSRYVNADGGDSMLNKNANPALMVENSDVGPGVVATSAANIALRGETGSTAQDMAGVFGVAGPTSTMLPGGAYAGVYGKSRYGFGVAGLSDANVGVYGQSGTGYGVYGTAGGSLAGGLR